MIDSSFNNNHKSPTITSSTTQYPTNLNQIHFDTQKNTLDTNFNNQQQTNCEDQNTHKKSQNKLKYRRLRQKLTSMSYQHHDPSLITDLKEVTSPNKSRILKLAIQFEKLTQTQNREYTNMQNVLKQFQKILEHRRQHDLIVLRQSKFIPTVSIIFKTIPALHKNQLLQSLKTIWMSLRILRYLSSLGTNRNYLLLTNQLTVLNTLLSCLLGKQQRKVGLQCLTVLNQLLNSTITNQAQPIVSTTLQLIFCSQIIRKIKVNIQSCINQEGLSDQQFMLSSLSYLYTLLKRYFKIQIEEPIDKIEEYQSPKIFQCQAQSLISFLFQLIADILFQKDIKQDEMILRQQQLPSQFINTCLFTLKILNILFHINYIQSQKIFQNTISSQQLKALNYLLYFSKQNLNESSQLKSLCNQMMILIGNISLNNKNNQQIIRESGLLQNLFNHHMEYLMEPLKNIYIPSLCGALYGNKTNIAQTFIDNSPILIIKYIQKQTSLFQKNQQEEDTNKSNNIINVQNITFQKSRTLSRTGSMSSLTSSKSYTTQQSHNIIIGNMVKPPKQKQKGLCIRFPKKFWQEFVNQLNECDA